MRIKFKNKLLFMAVLFSILCLSLFFYFNVKKNSVDEVKDNTFTLTSSVAELSSPGNTIVPLPASDKVEKIASLMTAIDNLQASDLQTVTQDNYEKCVEFSTLLSHQSYQDVRPDNLESYLSRCRLLRNRYGISEARIKRWKQLGGIVQRQGWPAIIAMIERGELAAMTALQMGTPSHDLGTLFIMNDVTDREAYQSLMKYGLMPNSKFFSYALLKNNQTAKEFYEHYGPVYQENDLLFNAVTQAAANGTIDDIMHYLEMGVNYYDSLNRDPLKLYLKMKGSTVDPEKLTFFLERYQPSMESYDSRELKSYGVTPEVLKIIIHHLD